MTGHFIWDIQLPTSSIVKILSKFSEAPSQGQSFFYMPSSSSTIFFKLYDICSWIFTGRDKIPGTRTVRCPWSWPCLSRAPSPATPSTTCMLYLWENMIFYLCTNFSKGVTLSPFQTHNNKIWPEKSFLVRAWED